MFLQAAIPHLPKHPGRSVLEFIRNPNRWKLLRRRSREVWWNSHWCEPGSFIYQLQRGVKMRLYLDSYLCRCVHCIDFESVEREFVNAFLRPGDIFVDVGANVGLFTLVAASRVGSLGRVLAFEPTAETFERLTSNVQLNGFTNCSLHRLALSDSNREMYIFQSARGYDSSNSFAKAWGEANGASEKVQAVTWDSFSEQHGLKGRVAMMKIDVEGWETFVLRGGASSLAQPDAPVLQVEFCDGAAEAAGSSCRDLYHLLESFNYRMFTFAPVAKQLVPAPLRDKYPYLNLFAVKDLGKANARLQAVAVSV
jgi:FkbM family methyltransferase